MRTVSILVITMLFIGSVHAQQERSYLTSFMEKAETFASSDLSMFKFDLGQRFEGVGNVKMNDLYAQFGFKWGNVVMALTMAKASKKSIGYVLTKYNRSKPTNWEKIAAELRITQDSVAKRRVDQLIASQVKAWKLDASASE